MPCSRWITASLSRKSDSSARRGGGAVSSPAEAARLPSTSAAAITVTLPLRNPRVTGRTKVTGAPVDESMISAQFSADLASGAMRPAMAARVALARAREHDLPARPTLVGDEVFKLLPGMAGAGEDRRRALVLVLVAFLEPDERVRGEVPVAFGLGEVEPLGRERAGAVAIEPDPALVGIPDRLGEGRAAQGGAGFDRDRGVRRVIEDGVQPRVAFRQPMLLPARLAALGRERRAGLRDRPDHECVESVRAALGQRVEGGDLRDPVLGMVDPDRQAVTAGKDVDHAAARGEFPRLVDSILLSVADQPEASGEFARHEGIASSQSQGGIGPGRPRWQALQEGVGRREEEPGFPDTFGQAHQGRDAQAHGPAGWRGAVEGQAIPGREQDGVEVRREPPDEAGEPGRPAFALRHVDEAPGPGSPGLLQQQDGELPFGGRQRPVPAWRFDGDFGAGDPECSGHRGTRDTRAAGNRRRHGGFLVGTVPDGPKGAASRDRVDFRFPNPYFAPVIDPPCVAARCPFSGVVALVAFVGRVSLDRIQGPARAAPGEADVARIAGVNIPTNKRVVIALQYIHGIGAKKAEEIVEKVAIPAERRVNQLTDSEVLQIRETIDRDYLVEGDLRREVSMNIKRLMDLGCYRGLRHRRNLPVRGQRTHTNARTRKGKSKPIAGKKK